MLVWDQVLSLLSELKFLLKKGQKQDKATALSSLMLAAALMVSHRIQTTKRPYHDYQKQVCHLLIPKKSHSIQFQVTKQKVLFCH